MMLLRVDSSARRNSVSRQLTTAFVSAWLEKHPLGKLIERDLAATPIPPITDEWTRATYAEPSKRTEEQSLVLALSETFIGELEAADLIVIGAPMYNFTISSPLKAWIDHIVRPGRTVGYGTAGQTGLLKGKKVVVLTSRGGVYAKGSERADRDFQEPYLRLILGYIELDDVTFIHADNQGQREQAPLARAAAVEQIQYFVSETLSPQAGQQQAGNSGALRA